MWVLQVLKTLFDAVIGKSTDKIAETVSDSVANRLAAKLEPLKADEFKLLDDVTVFPKGLNSFDENDSSFYLSLLPGPYRQDGLPQSVYFWKTRIEEVDPEKTFTVGLIYGPSGCGKSSFAKAGLVPQLDSNVETIYVAATPEDTEAQLLSALRTHCPYLKPKTSLKAALGRKSEIPENTKVLLVLDQFEQYLHATPADEQDKLISGLKECDGSRLQSLILIRDDFITPLTRFFDRLEVDISSQRNCRLFDLFDLRHSKKVLAMFGRAFGRFNTYGEITGEHDQFLNQAISLLAEGDYIICVRLALFAETIRRKDWVPATLRTYGGETGIGVAFLEASFSASTAPLENRKHRDAAKRVLQALLPETGMHSDEDIEPGEVIKGAMKSREELLEKSGYTRHPADFDDLLDILNSRLKMITPADSLVPNSDDEETAAASQSTERYFQLTHDYLVPALREWLSREQRQTRRGRAQLRLTQLAADWNARPEGRHLPTWWEHATIRLLTRRGSWTPSQRSMMRSAARYHGIRGSVLVGVFALLIWAGIEWNGVSISVQSARADLLGATVEQLPERVKKASEYPYFLASRLESYVSDPKESPQKRANVAAALLSMERTDKVWPQLEHQSDPIMQTYAIQRLAASGNPQPLIDRLAVEEVDSIRYAIVLALGEFEFDEMNLSENEKENVKKALKELFESDPSAGVHSAADWTLRQWGVTPPTLKETNNVKEWLNDHNWHANSIDMTMMLIPAGEFQRKADGADDAIEQTVTLTKSFLLSNREVTREQFRRFLEDEDEKVVKPPPHPKADEDYSPTEQHPMQHVSWYDAVMFCNWLSSQEDLTPCYKWGGPEEESAEFRNRQQAKWKFVEAEGYRLPTEAEWEYACRAGSSTEYSFGDVAEPLLERYAVYDAGQTEIPGSRRPNPWGLFDAHGNVWEWCHDRYGGYGDKAAVKDPRGPEAGDLRVLRGGSSLNNAAYARSAFRYYYGNPGFRNLSNGFRVARTYP